MPEHGFEHPAMRRAPGLPYLKIFLIGSLLFLSLVGLHEGILRYHGLQPSLSDDMRLWSIQRERIDKAQDTSDMVVLIGASRMQMGFSGKAFHDIYPNRPLVRLSISGKKPAAALKDLAENTDFKGTVLIAVYTIAMTPDRLKDQQPYVDFYHEEWNLNQRFNREIKTFMEENVLSRNPNYSIRYLSRSIRKNKFEPYYVTIDENRNYTGDYSLLGEKELTKIRKQRTRNSDSAEPRLGKLKGWLLKTQETEKWVRKITDRGGKVVFIRFPVDISDWKNSHGAYYPKDKFWDEYARNSQANFIHFTDDPRLQFSAPDGSHLDKTDAPIFTTNLLKILQEKEILQ